MLNMILKDLRISPLRNILTGISMFVGIIAMISSVLVGTLGKEYLISVNAQMYGWSPTYSFSITGSDFQDTIKMENFFREIYNTDHFVAVTFSMLEEITVAPVASVSSLQDISDTVYKKTVPVDVVFTTSTYNKIYNLPMSSGDWFDSSEINKTLCMVVNKAAQNYFDTSYAVGNVESSLSLTPFNVVGTVNDGTDIPTVYLDAHSIELLVPNMWKVKNATVHWHSEAGITMRQMYSSLHDILEDTIGGNLDIIGKSDIGDTYNSVLSVLQLGLLVTSFLLLFVSVLGQINIGLSSLEQRTHELLIRRAIGASRANIVTLVLGAQLTISVFVCIVSILISFFLVQGITSQRKQTVAAYLNDWVESYARVNLRPSTYDGYKKTIANYINPYIGGVTLNQLTPAMVDKMFQQIIDKGLKPSTAAGAKRVLSVALSHARKYRYIETNAAKDTLTKFGKGDKTPDPYTPEQVKALMQRVEGTVWEMPVILGGLYGMRRSEILGLRWRNVDLENNTFDVTEQLPFKVPPKTKVIEEMAPPKSNGRKLPITELARPFFLKQLAMQEVQKEQAAKDGKPYYDNDLVVAKPDGAPIAASWVSSQFGKLLEDLDMPHIRFHDLRHTAATNMHQLTGDFYTVGEVLGHTLAGIGASLGLSMNFEAVTARYVDVRLERKKEVLDAYHSAVEKAAPEKPKEAEPKKGKRAAKKKHSEIDL